MNSTEVIRNYKHDIAGKFKDISTSISSLNESSFNDSEAVEIFHAVHEVILKMVKTSINTIANSLNHEISLVATASEPNLVLPKLQIEGIVVRYETTGQNLKYIYSKVENQGSFEVHVEVLKTLLPFKGVNFEGMYSIATNFLKDMREEI